MNGTLYSNPTFPDTRNENIEELNKNNINENISNNTGKIIKVFTDFNEKEFIGRIEEITKKYIIMSNPDNGENYLIFIKNINYITSNETIKTLY